MIRVRHIDPVTLAELKNETREQLGKLKENNEENTGFVSVSAETMRDILNNLAKLDEIRNG